MKQKLIVANWKMNPQTHREAEGLLSDILRSDLAKGGVGSRKFSRVVVCPPFPFFSMFRSPTSFGKSDFAGLQLGAQDVFYEPSGAYTGEVSVSMLKDAKVKYVIVGHSERRDPPFGGGDTDEIVAKKLRAVLDGGLTPVLCVGEKERKGSPSTSLRKEKEFVGRQLESALKDVPPPPRRGRDDNEPRLVVAYEPVWAISNHSGGVSDTPESAWEMMRFIKEIFFEIVSRQGEVRSLRVLYGGSVHGKNVEGFLKLPECDGVLVGGASLKPKEFREIVEIARRYKIPNPKHQITNNTKCSK